MENLRFLGHFFQPPYTEPHTISLSEPTVLSMKFPTRVFVLRLTKVSRSSSDKAYIFPC